MSERKISIKKDTPRRTMAHSVLSSKRVRLTAHFDEDNIDKTYHPKRKDYGLMPITESKTPFPRKEDPVDASLLREKLLAMNKEFDVVRRSSTISDIDFDVDLTDSNSGSMVIDSFLDKRKKFDTAEFLITKQHPMCNDLHAPGHDVPVSLMRNSTTSTYTMGPPPYNFRRSTVIPG